MEKSKKDISCENCLHWKLYDDSMGRCLVSKKGNNSMYSGCGLITRNDFFCKIFEPK